MAAIVFRNYPETALAGSTLATGSKNALAGSTLATGSKKALATGSRSASVLSKGGQKGLCWTKRRSGRRRKKAFWRNKRDYCRFIAALTLKKGSRRTGGPFAGN